MKADLIIYHVSQLYTLSGNNHLRLGAEMKQVGMIENGFVASFKGKIIALGNNDDYLLYKTENTKLVNGEGLILTPGLIDSHTHLVHGGTREHEFEKKLSGVPYLEILKAGGGILSTVEATKNANFSELYDKARKSLDMMLTYGVTTVEAKSGYGLEIDTEIKQLKVAKQLNENHPVDIKSTFLGAHAVPSEYKEKKSEYIEEIIKMFSIIKKQGLAEYCDVFCEDEVFSIEETRYILNEAKKFGFKLKIHADEIMPLGGATLACELGCVSADHLMASTKEDFANLAKNKVVANLLPATSFSLDKDFAKAREMISAGCGIALSSDYNPGSCPSENLQFVMQLGSIKLKMLPTEVLSAVTINASCAINEETRIGSLEVGKDADYVLFDCPNLDYLLYHFGINHVKDVYKLGKLVVKDQKVCYKESEDMSLVDLKVKEFISEVDSNSPAPGGGSVSALAATLGVSLSRMVSHLTIGRKKFLELDENVRIEYEDNFITLNNIKEELIPLIDKDTLAYNIVMKAYKMPKETEIEKDKRNEAIEKATIEAIKVPHEIARLSYKALEVIVKMLPFGNKNAISDIGVGTLLLYTGLEGAIMNVKINLSSLNEKGIANMYQKSCEELLSLGIKLKEDILAKVYQSIG